MIEKMGNVKNKTLVNALADTQTNKGRNILNKHCPM